MNDSGGTPATELPASAGTQAPKPEKDSPSGVTLGITAISAVSLILTLLGYGVSLAVETMFGMPHQSVYASVFDLLGLSVYALISLVLGLGDVSLGPLIEQAWLPSLLVGLGMFLTISCLVLFKPRLSRIRTGTTQRWRFFAKPAANDSTGHLIGKAAVGSALAGGIVFLTPFLLVAAVISAVVLISIVPMFGMQLGEHYFRKFVVTPTACEPVKSRAVLVQAWAAPRKVDQAPVALSTCVDVHQDNERIASGRVVVATSTAIVLFDPLGGSVRRIPVAEVTMIPADTVHSPQP